MRADFEGGGVGYPDGGVGCVDDRGTANHVPGVELLAAVDVDFDASVGTAVDPDDTAPDRFAGTSSRSIASIDAFSVRPVPIARKLTNSIGALSTIEPRPYRCPYSSRNASTSATISSSPSGPSGSGIGISHT